MTMQQDLYSAVQDAVVELFTLDATVRGQGVLRFCAGTNAMGQAVLFNGNTYTALPITGAGWARTTGDSAPRPTLTISNVNSVIQSLVYSAGDISGSTLTRQRVYSKYLDAGNFPRWNLLNYSQDYTNATWSKVGMSTGVAAATAPDGTTTADFALEDTSTAGHYVGQTYTGFTAGQTYTVSAYVKPSVGTRFAQIVFTSPAFGSNLIASFNVSTGAMASTGSVTGTATSVGGGWYHITATATATITASAGIQLRHSTSLTAYAPSYTGDGTSSLIWWGAQLEVGSAFTTYQTTTTTHWFTSDTTAILSNDVYVVDRLVSMDKVSAQFELCWQLDRPGVRLPARLALRDLGFPGLGLNAP